MITNTTGLQNWTVQRGLCKKFHVKSILLRQCDNDSTGHNTMAVHWSDRQTEGSL